VKVTKRCHRRETSEQGEQYSEMPVISLKAAEGMGVDLGKGRQKAARDSDTGIWKSNREGNVRL